MLDLRERTILLNCIPELPPARVRRLAETFGSLERFLTTDLGTLQRDVGIKADLAHRIVACSRDRQALEEELSYAHAHGADVLTQDKESYPALLRQIHDPPIALYVQGALTQADQLAIAIVGTRRASTYGLRTAERLAYDLALRGVSVVSGLARGIDAAAHRGALKAKGRTLAVLGSGLARIYPEEHQELAAQIAQSGAVLSEFPMKTEPAPYNFPRRNRIISGLSLGVVVVEAARRSGALITSDFALEQGREVFSVPGPITTATSLGPHELIKQGAKLVTCADDVLEELHVGSRAQNPEPRTVMLPEIEQHILACVSEGQPRYIDAIAQQSGLQLSAVSSALLQLELKRLVCQLPGKQFVRKSGIYR